MRPAAIKVCIRQQMIPLLLALGACGSPLSVQEFADEEACGDHSSALASWVRPLTVTMMIITTMSKTLTLIRPPRLIFTLNNSSTSKLFLWRASTFHIFCLFH